jgi:hypothetical protein
VVRADRRADLGIKTQAADTALDRALREGVALMEENAAIRAQGDGGRSVRDGMARHAACVGAGTYKGFRMGGRGWTRWGPGKGRRRRLWVGVVLGNEWSAPGNLWQAAKAKAAALLTPGRIDKLIYELQDKYVDLRRIRDHIREIGGTITDLNDAYLGEELYHKRLAHRTQDFLKAELRPLLADMKARGVGMQELESFLHARHAPEANAEMAKRNPNQAEIDAGRRKAATVVRGLERNLQTAQARGLATKAIEQALNDARGDLVKWNGAQAFSGTEQERRSLSGMTDQAAAAIMAGLSPQRRADLDALATGWMTSTPARCSFSTTTD